MPTGKRVISGRAGGESIVVSLQPAPSLRPVWIVKDVRE